MAKKKEESLNIAFGKRVTQLREERGMKQYELADLCNADRTTIYRIENGLNLPSLPFAKRMAEAFGISLSELFEGL